MNRVKDQDDGIRDLELTANYDSLKYQTFFFKAVQ